MQSLLHIFLLSLSLIFLVHSLQKVRIGVKSIQSSRRLHSTEGNGRGEVGDGDSAIPTTTDTEAVDYVLSQVSKLLQGSGPSDSPDTDQEEVEQNFNKIFEGIRNNDGLSKEIKERMALELNIALDSVEGSNTGDLSLLAPERPEALEVPTSASYYSARAPYCVITGTGPVGKRVKQVLEALGGAAADVRYLDGSQINILQDAELKLALKDARSIIVATDSLQSGKKVGWFDKPEPFNVLTEKSLKRVLNTAVETRAASQDLQPIRVIALGKATKESKGVASMMANSGDAMELEGDAVLLQCKSRGFGYW